MSKKGRYTEQILRNAEKLNALKARIDETVYHRGDSPEGMAEWKEACAEYHQQYNMLAFPGGLDGAYDRIVSGDEGAVEAAICFLECRPYFFRSGYMFRTILGKVKRAPLSKSQSERLNQILQAYNEYKKSKKK